MKKHHTTFVLLTLFFTGLILYWWADKAEWEEPGDSHLVLPALNKTDAKLVRRVVIERPKDKAIVFERRGGNDWQMTQPDDVAANSAMVTTLVSNLRALRRSSEAGTITKSDDTYGLTPPAAVVRLYGDDANTPLAAIEVGGEVKGFRDQRYVRALGPKAKGIDVVDSRMVSQTNLRPIDWRERNVFDMPTFYVDAITVKGPGRDLEVKRDNEHWVIDSPLTAPADDERAEGLAAELSSLRVAKGDKGFVKDNATDFAEYGLDKPVMTITLKDKRPAVAPQTLDVGKPLEDAPELRYARRQDQNDVVLIDATGIADLGTRPNALRSQRVAQVTPNRVTFVTIEAPGRTFKLAPTSSEWVLLEPTRARADTQSVSTFLSKLSDVQTSDFIEPGSIGDPRVDPPIYTIKVWQAAPDMKLLPAEASEAPEGKPRVNLRIGRHDAIRKALYGQLAGDKYLLALPESFREVLPKSALAFRDRTILAFSPTHISRLSIERDKATYDLVAPDTPGQSVHWRMTRPIDAPADDEQATKVAMLLGNLSAADFVADEPAGDKAYGFDAPLVTAAWTLNDEAAKTKAKDAPPSRGTLRIGNRAPGTENRYARLDGGKVVFTVTPEVVEPLLGEFRDHRVISFVPATVERIVFRWPDRVLSFVRRAGSHGSLPEWTPEPGVDPTGFDVSKLNALLDGLSKLQTERFAQYVGILPDSYGLRPPRLTIELQFEGGKPRTLRLGNQSESGPLYATTASGSAGAVFTLAGPAWVELAKPPRRPDDLPEQVFKPVDR